LAAGSVGVVGSGTAGVYPIGNVTLRS